MFYPGGCKRCKLRSSTSPFNDTERGNRINILTCVLRNPIEVVSNKSKNDTVNNAVLCSVSCFKTKRLIQSIHDYTNPQSKDFVATKSRKSPAAKILGGDGDKWIERIVWDEKAEKFRSYFKSQNTNTRKWDEPPSGASKIIPAAKAQNSDKILCMRHPPIKKTNVKSRGIDNDSKMYKRKAVPSVARQKRIDYEKSREKMRQQNPRETACIRIRAHELILEAGYSRRKKRHKRKTARMSVGARTN